MGPEADAETIRQARQAVEADPTAWVAQEFLDFSTHVLDGSSEAQEAFVDLRAFVLPRGLRDARRPDEGGQARHPRRQLLGGRQLQGHLGAGGLR
ncbi:hypothetical protein GBA65_19210 [Rubrobacter marinus]|uniref:Uncharacterized protein n=1 Tax=Rubrobacter marinus TaxID=2653852 RepID=A0A6G8Q1I1_9ACTN|nr:hypothetical protein GBA65_19210 [Rubrobacter marinus]